MTKHSQTTTSMGKSHRGSRQSGHSLIELAIVISFLLILALGTTDFARVFYAAIELNDAARAGARYGSQTVVTAADSTGMINAAKASAPNFSTITATASQCTCASGSSVAACTSSYCTNNPNATFVTVNSQLSFTTIASYPGIPSSLALTGKSVMAVQQ